MGLYDRILVTGGRGMLAHAFQRVLDARGLQATFLSRVECDITNPGAVRGVFDDLRPTLLINCAAYTEVDQAEKEPELANQINGLGPGILAVACAKLATSLVHFSTDYVFDGSSTRPWRTDDPVNPQSAYGRSKLLGERAIAENGGALTLIVRTAWLYGPDGPNFVQTMLNAARAGKALTVVNDQVGSPTYTVDLAEATLDLLDSDRGDGIFHVTNSGQTTWYDFAGAIFEEWGLSPRLRPITTDEWERMKPGTAKRPAYSVLEMERFEHLVGRQMRPWRDALRAFRTPSA
jgi:dTDP-4-dehydrorhamnose reductase